MTTGTPVNIDVDISWPGNDIEFKQNNSIKKAGSGKTETISLYEDKIGTVNILFGTTARNDLAAWWAWAKNGNSWAFTFLAGSSAKTILSSSLLAGTTNLSLNDPYIFSNNDVCFLESDKNFEIAKIDIISCRILQEDGSLILTENGEYLINEESDVNIKTKAIYSYSSGDTFRQLCYYPKVEILNNSFEPIKVLPNLYKYTLAFREIKST